MRRGEPAHASFGATIRAAWRDLPVLVGVSVVWTLPALAIAAALAAGSPLAAFVLVGPWLVVTTLAFGAVGAVLAGRPVRRGAFAEVDPVLALIGWWAIALSGSLIDLGGTLAVAGFVLAAAICLVAPMTLAFGAVHHRRGVAAIRGGIVLSILRPDVALCAAAWAVIAVFAIASSAGALGLFLPALVAVFPSLAVRAELQRRGVEAQ